MTLKVSVRPVSNLSQFSFEVLSFRGLVSPLSPKMVRLTDPSVPAFGTFEVTTTRSVQRLIILSLFYEYICQIFLIKNDRFESEPLLSRCKVFVLVGL